MGGESVLFMLHKNIHKGHFVNILYMTSVLHYTAGATEEGPLQNPQKMGPSYRVCSSKSRGDWREAVVCKKLSSLLALDVM